MWKISLVNGGPSIPIKKKIKVENKYKINKKINEMKVFFFKIKKREKKTGFKKKQKKPECILTHYWQNDNLNPISNKRALTDIRGPRGSISRPINL